MLCRGETVLDSRLTHRSPKAIQKRNAELLRASNRQRVAFIETDIETAMTFLQLADTELLMGNVERVTTLVGSARTAYEATGRFLARVPDPEERERLREQRCRLEEAIRDVEQRIQSR
jgi:hypothetical protein